MKGNIPFLDFGLWPQVNASSCISTTYCSSLDPTVIFSVLVKMGYPEMSQFLIFLVSLKYLRCNVWTLRWWVMIVCAFPDYKKVQFILRFHRFWQHVSHLARSRGCYSWVTHVLPVTSFKQQGAMSWQHWPSVSLCCFTHSGFASAVRGSFHGGTRA